MSDEGGQLNKKFKDYVLCRGCNRKIDVIIKCYDKEIEKKHRVFEKYETIEAVHNGCTTTFINYSYEKMKKMRDFLCRKCDLKPTKVDKIIPFYYHGYNKYKVAISFLRKKEHQEMLRCTSVNISSDCDKINNKKKKRGCRGIFNKRIGNKSIDELTKQYFIPHNRFKDIVFISEGGFAKVYSATWKKGSGPRKVALKVLNNSKNISEHLLREVKNLTALPKDCEGVIKFYGITQDPETQNYVLVLKLEECSLRLHLDKYYNLHLWERKLYIEKICLGLSNIHKHGLIHKDLHSGNILRSGWSNTCISDFGFCKPANEEITSNSIEKKTYGVMPYMAPEILRGNEYTKKSDIYSLGVIINEIISIFPPFYNQPHDHYLALDICRGLRPEIREETPKPLKELIQKCWDANPNNRPTSEQVLEEIKNMNINESELSYDLDSITIANSTSKIITHPQATYTSKILYFPNLPDPVRQVQTESSECLDCVITD